jgi:hypothetical protein
MDTATTEIPTVSGTPFAGGFFVARFLVGTEIYALVAAPKAEGEHEESEWGPTRPAIAVSDRNYFDGFANTRAMADAGSELAKWAQGLRIGGFDDWYIPSRDELELCYRAFKPGTEENFCGSGDNPSAMSTPWPYSLTTPAQTNIEAFKAGGAEAFEETWYWTSTQYAGDESFAWYQTFGNGYQYDFRKDFELRARAVRRVKI